MFCSHCGAKLTDGQPYCHNCGAAVQPNRPQQPHQQPYRQPQAQQPAPVEKKPNPLAPTGLALGIAGALLALLTFAFLYDVYWILAISSLATSAVGVILSSVAISKARKGHTGYALALAGVVTSAITAFFAFFTCYGILLSFTYGG